MVEAVSIGTEALVAEGLDYASLRKAGLALIQALSGGVWTDYNESDPGVTILEQLCYALTELGYRSGFKIADLLVDERGQIEPDRHALFVAAQVLPCNPVTIGDYRKLFVDRVPAVRNAWLEPVDPSLCEGVNGLYRLRVYAPSADPCEVNRNPTRILERIEAVYVRHRALCEDLVEPPTLLVERPTRVGGRIALAPDAEPNRTLARVQFAIGSFLAPELERRSLAGELASDKTPDQIFTGPLLEHGFIDDQQLQPKLRCFGLRELAGVIADVPGVVGVSGIELWVGSTRFRGNQTVPIGPDEVLVYVPRCRSCEQGDAEPTLHLVKGRAPVSVDCRRVDRLRGQLWAEYRRAYPLAEQYETLLGFPQGRRRPLARYTSIQDQFPVIYGINEYGLPSTSGPVRRGQAKQLKGYLLAFEQLLTDFFAQLAEVRRLYSRDRELSQTYFWQTLCGAVPAIEPLLDADYERGLADLVASTDPVVQRRNEQTAFLLGIHAERLDPANVVSGSCGAEGDEPPDEQQLAAKLDLLDVLLESGRDRGRGLDYGGKRQAGMVLKSRIQLGMGRETPAKLSDLLDELGADIAAPGVAPTFGRELQSRSEDLRDGLRPVAHEPGSSDDELGGEAERLRGQTLSTELLASGGELGNYRYQAQGRAEQVTLLCALPGRRWCYVSRYADATAAKAGARRFSRLIADLRRRSQQLVIIEHVLLRWALQGPQPQVDERGFEYSFTLTAVIAGDVQQIGDPQYRSFAAEVIRSNAAAHTVVDLCFLDAGDLVEFELVYWPWCEALARQDSSKLASSSRQLQAFLLAHRWQEPDAW